MAMPMASASNGRSPASSRPSPAVPKARLQETDSLHSKRCNTDTRTHKRLESTHKAYLAGLVLSAVRLLLGRLPNSLYVILASHLPSEFAARSRCPQKGDTLSFGLQTQILLDNN